MKVMRVLLQQRCRGLSTVIIDYPHLAEAWCGSLRGAAPRAASAVVGRQFYWSRSHAMSTATRDGDSIASPSQQTLEDRLGPLSTKPTVPESRPLVIVISGPSGVGKDAVIKSLREARPDLAFVVTATSREMRPGEVDGQDYFFVSRQQFEAWLAEGSLLEHAVVYGQYKGIPRSQVESALAKGSDVVLRIDVQGAETVRTMMPGVVSIFLVADSEAELVNRLVARKTEPLDNLLTRIQTARAECGCIADFDYVVVNREGQLEETVRRISAVIDAEKLRTRRRLAAVGSPSPEQQAAR